MPDIQKGFQLKAYHQTKIFLAISYALGKEPLKIKLQESDKHFFPLPAEEFQNLFISCFHPFESEFCELLTELQSEDLGKSFALAVSFLTASEKENLVAHFSELETIEQGSEEEAKQKLVVFFQEIFPLLANHIFKTRASIVHSLANTLMTQNTYSSKVSDTLFQMNEKLSNTLISCSEGSLIEATFKPKEVLADRFEIIELLNSGGMGKVYKVKDQKLNEIRALKVIHQNLNQEEKFRQRFLEEVKVSTKLSHPNILRVYDIGEEEGLLFLMMEWIQGKTLREHLMKKGPFSWEEARKIIQEISNGMEYAHHQNVLHLDIKPENIMIDNSGVVKIVDFGLARALGNRTFLEFTEKAGTLGYMAPEQYKGHIVGKEADLYSLAVLCYELLSGQLPVDDFSLQQNSVPDSFSNLLQQTITSSADKRPAIHQFLEILNPNTLQVAKSSLPIKETSTLSRKISASIPPSFGQMLAAADIELGCLVMLIVLGMGYFLGKEFGGVMGSSYGSLLGLMLGLVLGFQKGFSKIIVALLLVVAAFAGYWLGGLLFGAAWQFHITAAALFLTLIAYSVVAQKETTENEI